MKISNKLYKLRNDRGLTQSDMGEIAGVSDKTISAWEAGNRCPKIVPYIQNICNHFHLDMFTFIDEGTDDMGYNSEQPTVSDGLSEVQRELIAFAKTLTAEQAGLALRVLKSIVEDEP